MADILFSGVGSSDPVRGLHDGAMLHIVRHYKPAEVYLFITAEMKQHDDDDDRYSKAIKSLEKSIGYCPRIHKIDSGIVDVDDFDAFMDPFKAVLDDIAREHPEDRILLNLSSGTVQMKTTMCLRAMDVRYRALGVQVRNWEKRSGQSERTTSKKYELDVELELNEDNEPDAANTCQEPKTIVWQRDKIKEQLRSLISQYNYKAALQLAGENYADQTLLALLAHAAARQELQEVEARKAVKNLQIDKSILYPVKLTSVTSKCYELMEYFLILQNYQRTARYTEMVIRMNPFVLALQKEYLDLIPGFSVEDICYTSKDGRIRINRDNIKKLDEILLNYVEYEMDGEIRNADPSIYVYNLILHYYAKNKRLKKLSEKDILFLDDCEVINRKFRNDAAHNLKCVDESNITEATEKRLDGVKIINRFRDLLEKLYGDKCPEESFEVYDKINGIISGLL